MRTRWLIVLVLGALLALTQTASAQRRGGRGFGRGMMMNPVFLLNRPEVQKELNLTDEQKDKVKDTFQKVQEKMAPLRDMSQEERQEKAPAIMKEANEEAQKSLKGLLKPEQDKRLHQIMLQMRGPQAFTDAKIQEKLKLSDDQKNSIKSIMEDQQKEIQEARDNMDFQKMGEIRRETNNKLQGVLNDDQK
ncbi:MAG TPA: hypothetical protein VFA18_11355, partial [Gemmataceae bacterium]|nr:hypothetical protein [Gemmataceae bacterium]